MGKNIGKVLEKDRKSRGNLSVRKWEPWKAEQGEFTCMRHMDWKTPFNEGHPIIRR